MEKMTKKQMFEMIKGVVSDNADMVAFIDHEIDLLNRKGSKSTPSKNQIENEGIKKIILDTLTALAKPSTITEIQGANEDLATYSNQKMSALLKQLVDSKVVVKSTDKKKTYFSVV